MNSVADKMKRRKKLTWELQQGQGFILLDISNTCSYSIYEQNLNYKILSELRS